MGIVVITIPEEAKREFVNQLHAKTNGGVDLVIVQKPKHYTVAQSIRRMYKTVGLARLPKELWYVIMLRIDRNARQALKYFRDCTANRHTSEIFVPPTIEIDSVNDDLVFEKLKNLKPDLMIVWGTAIIKPHIIGTAERAINLHMGHCPEYRGAVANQFAVLNKDFTHIGATVHYVTEKVDAGDILTRVKPDLSKSPQAMFLELNDKAQAAFLKIAVKLAHGKYVSAQPQDISRGKNILMKQWTHEVRYKLGHFVLQWERKHKKGKRVY